MIPLSIPSITELEHKLVEEVLEQGLVATSGFDGDGYVRGPYVDQLETIVKKLTGARDAIAVSSASVGLQVCLRAIGVRPFDAVLIPNYTFCATANAVRAIGAEPIFVDSVSPTNLNMDMELARTWIASRCERAANGVHDMRTGQRIAAVLPVTTFGNPVTGWNWLNLPVVIDAACGFGATLGSQDIGQAYPLLVCSLNGNKLHVAGGGGIIASNNLKVAKNLRCMVNNGKGADGLVSSWGINATMPNLNAALAYAQFTRHGDFVSRRRLLDKDYRVHLKDCQRVVCLGLRGASLWSFPVLCDSAEIAREIVTQLRVEGIEARIPWAPLNSHPAFKWYRFIDAGVSTKHWDRILFLPFFHDMSLSVIERVSGVIRCLN